MHNLVTLPRRGTVEVWFERFWNPTSFCVLWSPGGAAGTQRWVAVPVGLGCAGWWWGLLGVHSHAPALPLMHLVAHKKAVVHSCPVGEPQDAPWGATKGSCPTAHPLLGGPPSTFPPRGKQTRGGFALKDSLQTGTGLSGGGVVGRPFCSFVGQYKGAFPPGPRSPGPAGCRDVPSGGSSRHSPLSSTARWF